MEFLVLILIPLIVGMYAQIRVQSAYGKYRQIPAKSGITGKEAAEIVMQSAGIYDVQIVQISGELTDHYDPTKKVLALSREVYAGHSLAALGVAAHEAGHAIQHKQNYAPLKLRMALVPITMFASQFLPVVMFAGFFLFNSILALDIGIAIYLILTVFQLVTLPVEFDASNRAKAYLAELGAISGEEKVGVRKTLDAAAFTYVAAFVSSLGWLLYLVSMRDNR